MATNSIACVSGIGERKLGRKGKDAFLFISVDAGRHKIPIGLFALGGKHSNLLCKVSYA